MDPFVTSASVVYEVRKALAVVVPTLPLSHDSQQVDLQDSPPPPNGAEGIVRPAQPNTDVPEVGRLAGDLEKPFTRGALLSFHDPPRHYTLARKATMKSDSGTPSVVFVLRSSPKIIEEDSSDEDLELEDRDDDGDKTTYFFPCEDSKINKLVSMMASLSLGTGMTVARPTVTPTRVRARVPPFDHAHTPVSSPVAVSHPVVAHPSTAERATPMEVDDDVLHPKVVNKDAPHPQKIPEAVPMDGIVFHPEAKDTEMADAFVINRKLPV